ncbi:AGE family epimerase/isomerase [Adhaeribacter aquaticus]|uniref:AGE family epimerase/isomerase n=1 Tax=Adhaeribacter aquaticus TaxID=299567 RepID=UPI00040E7395|nr:AGE family epimerase/isomerase [Adhaeribacter aquaticus]
MDEKTEPSTGPASGYTRREFVKGSAVLLGGALAGPWPLLHAFASDNEPISLFLDKVLLSWRKNADTPNALFHPYFDRQWQRYKDGPRTLVTQTRITYNFMRAFERTGDQAYAQLALRGLDALTTYFWAGDNKGWHWSCHPDGRLLDDTSDAYGQAFVILVFSTAAAVFKNDHYRDMALLTWQYMQQRFRDKQGGLVWKVNRDGRVLDTFKSQNPMMHVFEALLALAPLDTTGTVRKDATGIWHFIRARMPSPGCLPEWYDTSWQPVRTGDKAIIEVGHAFEWAFLLSEAQALNLESNLMEPAREFLAYGMQHGYDSKAGGIFSRVDLEGNLLKDTRKGWWEQCEAIRTMQRYVTRHNSKEIIEPLKRSIDFVRQHYMDAVYGGWYENPPGLGGTESLIKGSMYKLDYHVVNMCREILAADSLSNTRAKIAADTK